MAQRPAVDRGKVDAMADVPADEIAPLLAVPLDRFVELRTASTPARPGRRPTWLVSSTHPRVASEP
jgi:hypothetical protein